MKRLLLPAADVRAFHEDRKTMFRVPVDPQPKFYPSAAGGTYGWDGDGKPASPLGVPGDMVWVPETFALKSWTDKECAKAGCPGAPKHPTEIYPGLPLRAIYRESYQTALGDAGPWRSSTQMPCWASRLTLAITAVRVELLQSISVEDAKSEGVAPLGQPGDGRRYRAAFHELWNTRHAKRHGWDANDWVWAYSCKRVDTEKGD